MRHSEIKPPFQVTEQTAYTIAMPVEKQPRRINKHTIESTHEQFELPAHDRSSRRWQFHYQEGRQDSGQTSEPEWTRALVEFAKLGTSFALKCPSKFDRVYRRLDGKSC
jgi:hypothetical protein